MSFSKPYHVELNANKSAYIYLFNKEVYYVPPYHGEGFRDRFGFKIDDTGFFDIRKEQQLTIQEYVQNKGPLYLKANFLGTEFLLLNHVITKKEFENLKVMQALKE